MKQDMIVILDLGSTKNTAIARQIREMGVYSEIHPHDITPEELGNLQNVKGIILNGGENRVVDGVTVDINPALYQRGYPMLAIDHPTAKCERKMETFPEEEQLREFVFDVCQASANWNMKNFIEDQVELVRRKVGDKKVLLALSGGVDSSVVAALLIKAIGKQLVCVHVNHGLMRKGESESVVEVFKNQMDANLVYVDAQERFLGKLAGVADPEQKRKIIGTEFFNVFWNEIRKQEDKGYFAQGTIYPDCIESGKGDADVIKTHHNRVSLPDDVEFLGVIEPLADLFKDEVRKVGEKLGIPKELVWRQPFPGPGLGVRIIGELTAEKIKVLQEADWVLRDEMAKNGYEKNLAQFFCVLPGVQTVGVMGDHRTYDNLIAIRAVTTDDFMTADWAKIPYDILAKVSNRITNEVEHVNRVVYDITSKPPGTVEWE